VRDLIEPERISQLNNCPVRNRGKYILYWMQAAQRAHCNHALEFAIQRANELHLPVFALFGLTDNYPEANLRHYSFMLEGLRQTQKQIEDRSVKFVIRHESPDLAAIKFSKQAAMVITDDGYLRIQRKWRNTVAQKIDCPLYEVTTNLIVPVEQASFKEEFSAGTFRPRITAKLGYYLKKLNPLKPKINSTRFDFDCFDISDIHKALAKLKIDITVKPVGTLTGGTNYAKKLLSGFVKKKLDRFADERNDPNLDCISHLSPYLHFGQISPLYIALEIMKTKSPGKDAFLEELIVRRELSHNFVWFNRNYDTFDALPPWAKRTLNFHRRDKREYLYPLDDLEQAKTHDQYWNAAQKEMVLTGKMHGYMRMYWGKKIIEWSKNPQQAFKAALYLNNKYELDGRDPNGFTGVAWCFGKHDRAWSERPIFGKIRYMNAAGLKRKFDIDGYVGKINEFERTVTDDK
jgi:deoxyribodipyrimidine photo-lyase